MPAKVAIIDQHHVFREGFSALPKADARFGVLSFTPDEPLDEIAQHLPDVVVCDPIIRGRFSSDFLIALNTSFPDSR